MRALHAAPLAALGLGFALAACGGKGTIGGDDTTGDGGPGGPPDACVGLQCMQVSCTGQGIGTTRLSGHVYAPNGTLPLYNVTVYVPNSDPGPIASGLTCDRCNDVLPGNPVVSTTSDETGYFQLDNVPVTTDLPVIFQVGKWRRQVKIATVNKCADNPIDAQTARLPKNRNEGDMPDIAIATGGADALECLPLKLGIDPKEITKGGGGGKVELFAGNSGTDSFAAGFANTGTFPKPEDALWDSLTDMSKFDIAFFSCEGSQPSAARAPAAALKAVYDYANAGGRVFLSHWHNKWIEQAPAVWPMIATFAANNGDTHGVMVEGTVDQGTDRGKALYKWLGNVMALDAKNMLPINAARNTCTSVDTTKATRFVYTDNAASTDEAGNPVTLNGPQDIVFTTPNDKPETDRCGKVVFSDMHVASGSTSDPSMPYPSGCSTAALTPQEKALAFIFFDIASCVGPVVN